MRPTQCPSCGKKDRVYYGNISETGWLCGCCGFRWTEDTEPNMTTHATGAVRSSDADAVRYDLLSPIALESWAKTCAEGAGRYGDFNWEKGFPAHDLLNHALRHQFLFLSGDRSEDHLGHALWNVAAAIHSLALWPHLNDGKLRREGCLPPETGKDGA